MTHEEEEGLEKWRPNGLHVNPRKPVNEYKFLLTKLAEMLFALGGEFKYVLDERDKDEYKEVDDINFFQAEDFVFEIADQLRKFDLKDPYILISITSWDTTYTKFVTGDIDGWIRYYVHCHLDESRLEQVKQFISEQELIANSYEPIPDDFIGKHYAHNVDGGEEGEGCL